MTKIEEIFTEFDNIETLITEKAAQARFTAKKAYKNNNFKKWDKFNAIARVYEMMHSKIYPVCAELLDQTSKEFQEKQTNYPF